MGVKFMKYFAFSIVFLACDKDVCKTSVQAQKNNIVEKGLFNKMIFVT